MELILKGILAGVLGTLIMDSLNLLFARIGMISKIDVSIIGIELKQDQNNDP